MKALIVVFALTVMLAAGPAFARRPPARRLPRSRPDPGGPLRRRRPR
jgi:hypothetical protein